MPSIVVILAPGASFSIGGLAAAVRLAVDDDRARAALAVFAADLATRQQHLLAQDVGEGGGLLGDDPAVDAVHIQ